MYSSEGEQIPFTRIINPMASKGQVEDWLRQVEEVMLKSVKDRIEKALQDYTKKDREICKLNYINNMLLQGLLVGLDKQYQQQI